MIISGMKETEMEKLNDSERRGFFCVRPGEGCDGGRGAASDLNDSSPTLKKEHPPAAHLAV